MKRLVSLTLLGLILHGGSTRSDGQVVTQSTGVEIYAGPSGTAGAAGTVTFGPWAPGVPYYGPGYPYYDGWPYYGYYPYPYALPPLFAPAESLYGPQAVQRFLGIGRTSAPVVAQPDAAPAGNAIDVEPRPFKIRVTNAETKARAGKFVSFGDAHFGNRKYNEALERYRTASITAPDLAETYLRQGHALVAMGNYESAGKAFRRGLGVRSDWGNTAVRLDAIYGDANREKVQHLEELAEAADQNPQDSNLLFLLGMQLYFDGQTDRSQLFFQRAAQLGGNEDRLLDYFLPPAGALAPAAAPVAAPPRAGVGF